MQNLLLTYNNQTFTVEVDDETYMDVTKDFTTLNNYARIIYEQAFSEKAQGSSSNVNSEVSDSVASGSQMNNFNEANSKLKRMRECKDSDSSVQWTDQLIRCLLDSRLSKETQFINPSCKKIKLWHQIAVEISNISGITISGEMCDIKYRNMFSTYRANKKKQSTSVEGAIRWEYFQLFDSVLGCKASSLPPKNQIGDSLEDEEESTETQNILEPVDTATDENESINSKKHEDKHKKNVKRKAGLSLQHYLFQKRQRDESKEKQNEEKMRWERQKWEEQKMLKQQEINAVLKLAETLAQKK